MPLSDEINMIANDIANQGKKPSIALIKNKLSSNVPLPMIISTLKNWQHDPEFIPIINKTSTAIKTHAVNYNADQLNINADQLNIAIEEALIPFKQEIVELKLAIAEINKQLYQAP